MLKHLVALALLAAFTITSPAMSDKADDMTALHARLVERALTGTILPDHLTLVLTAQAEAQAMAAFCIAPSPQGLKTVRDAFRRLVSAFSRVEMYRFGPGLVDNRLARLNFWPDRRGLGARQTIQIITSEDQTALDPERLAGKSVAVQGLSALEIVLFDNADTGSPFICAYGQAITAVIQDNAKALSDAWQVPQAALLRNPGPENPLYRDHGEALQALLKAAMEQIRVVEAQKLGRVLRTGPADTNPQAAQFWRSGLMVPAAAANIDASRALLNLTRHVDADHSSLAGLLGEVNFELTQSLGALQHVADDAAQFDTTSFATHLQKPETYGLLNFARIPLRAVIDLYHDRMLPALGLTRGFNALDGD